MFSEGVHTVSTPFMLCEHPCHYTFVFVTLLYLTIFWQFATMGLEFVFVWVLLLSIVSCRIQEATLFTSPGACLLCVWFLQAHVDDSHLHCYHLRECSHGQAHHSGCGSCLLSKALPRLHKSPILVLSKCSWSSDRCLMPPPPSPSRASSAPKGDHKSTRNDE